MNNREAKQAMQDGQEVAWDGARTFWIVPEELPKSKPAPAPESWWGAWRSQLVLVTMVWAAVMLLLFGCYFLRQTLLDPVTPKPGSCVAGPHHSCQGGAE